MEKLDKKVFVLCLDFCTQCVHCTVYIVCAGIYEVTGLIYFIFYLLTVLSPTQILTFIHSILYCNNLWYCRLGLSLDLGSLAWFKVKNGKKEKERERGKKKLCWTINQFIVIVNLSKNWTRLRTIGILLFSILFFFSFSTFLYAFQWTTSPNSNSW